MGRRLGLIIWCVLLALVPGLVCVARGQEDMPDPNAAPVAPPAAAVRSGEVDVEVIQFGLGGLVRPGDWCGVLLGVTDRTTKVRGLVVRLDIPDSDGDTAWMQVNLAANPNVKQRVWVYTRLPFSLGPNPLLRIQAFEAIEDDGVARTGRLVGELGYRVQGQIPPVNGLTALVGRQTLGLEQYGMRLPGNNWAPIGHQLWERPVQLKPADLPDRWMGLASFDTLLWTASGAEGEPAELTRPQAEAVREWVERGGHLIVQLPSAGQTWTNAAANPLFEITPRVTVQRQEGVDLNLYRRLLIQPKADGTFETVLPKQALVQSFVPVEGASVAEATPILAGPERDTVVVRRTVGAGAVTLIGLDLTSRSFQVSGGLDADVFWHRVLGRRAQLETAETFARMSGIGPSAGPETPGTRGSGPVVHTFNARTERPFDRGFAAAIAKKGESALGLLLAFIVFAVYWLCAGPLGFAVLKRKRLSHHAWVSFALATAVFTAIAWGGATLIKIRTVEGRHLTVLDHVYGQNIQRARSWMGLLLPSYGVSEVRLGGAEDALKNVIAPWEPPGTTLGSQFPDAGGYAVDARSPSVLRVPSRATVKQFQVDWAGGPPWRMPTPVIKNGAGEFEAGGSIRLADRETGVSWVEGLLRHDLPGELTDVTIAVVRGQDLRRQTHARQLLSDMQFWSLGPRAWRPREVLDLTAETSTQAVRGELSRRGGEDFLQRFFDNITEWDEAGEGVPDRLALERRLLALTYFPLLELPQTASGRGESQPLARRRMLHGWDLARWSTQPCLIITGRLVETGVPIPISVDGSDPAATQKRITGMTFVRWVYPLGSAAPSVRQADEADEERRETPGA